MIGERIQQARKAAGLSLRALSEQAGVTAMAISKYERNESTPSSKALLGLSKALGVRTEYFFRQVIIKLENVEHREHEKLPEKEEAKVLADVKEQLERWIELEKFIPNPWSMSFDLPKKLPTNINSYDDIEQVADTIRAEWALGSNPIPVLIDTLEVRGIKVFITQYDGHKHFNGLSATVNGNPVIVVGKHWPGDRQRFTLAHELGHLVLHGRLGDELDEEQACHRFAGAFLVPQDKVKSNLGNKRTWIEPRELMILKQEYGLSMGGWLYRARDLGVLPKQHFDKLRGYFNKRGWREKEPEPQFPQETTRMYEQLVYHALAENLVGESKAAELLNMSVSTLHACRKMECPENAVNQ